MTSRRPSVTLFAKKGQQAEARPPFAAPGVNMRLLNSFTSSRQTLVKYDKSKAAFVFTKTRAPEIIDGLVCEFGAVLVIVHGHASSTCVSQCWDAKAEKFWECVCGCAGANHGTGEPLGVEVAAGLSVSHDYVRSQHIVTRDGRRIA